MYDTIDYCKRLKNTAKHYVGGVIGESLNGAANEIERLERYEALVRFIANDYHELSYDKAYWQRDYWKKRCKKLLEEG